MDIVSRPSLTCTALRRAQHDLVKAWNHLQTELPAKFSDIRLKSAAATQWVSFWIRIVRTLIKCLNFILQTSFCSSTCELSVTELTLRNERFCFRAGFSLTSDKNKQKNKLNADLVDFCLVGSFGSIRACQGFLCSVVHHWVKDRIPHDSRRRKQNTFITKTLRAGSCQKWTSAQKETGSHSTE